MKNRTALSLAISLVMACPTALQALGLGELHSSSQLNQPLRAKIDLLSTSASQASKLQVRLASADVFRRVGIDRPAYLENLRFTPTVSKGKPVIRVTSSTPISEPFLNFLLEVSWPQGQLLKEYTVLLDPPVLLQSGNTTVDNSASVRAEPRPAAPAVNRQQLADQQRRKQQLERQRQQQIRIQQQQRQQAQAVTAEQRRLQAQQELFEAQARAVLSERTATAPTVVHRRRRTTTSKYRVRRGDTVSRVATKLRYRGVSNSQMMIALFRANPHAFSNDNINNLKAGVLLSKPSKSFARRASSKESKRLIAQHYTQWKKYRSGLATNTVAQKDIKAQSSSTTPVKVRTSPDSNNDTASLKVAGRAGNNVSTDNALGQNVNAQLQQKVFLAQEALASSRSESAELISRVSKLEAIIRKKDRLINLKNERLAKLESQLSGVTRVTEPEDLVNQLANDEDQASNRIIRAEDEPTGNIANDIANISAPLKTEVEKSSNPFVDDGSEEANDGILGFLSSPLVAAIGGGSLLALLFGWLLMRRSSRNNIQDVGASIQEDDFFDDELDADNETNQLDDYIDEGDHAGITDNAFEDDINDTESEQGFDQLLATEDNLEDDEIVQEADVYIVYGLYDQAEDELTKAIKNNPEKMVYRHKLLETYKVSGNKDAFVATAKEFLEAKGENKDKYWESIVKWGKKIAPDESIFSNSTAKKALIALGSVAGVGAAVKVAKDAFSNTDTKSDDFGTALSDSEDYTLDGDFDTTLGLDPKAVGDINDFNLDLDDDLDLGLDDKLDSAASHVSQKVDETIDLDLGLDDKLDSAASHVSQKVDETIDLDLGLDDKLDSAASHVSQKVDETIDLDFSLDDINETNKPSVKVDDENILNFENPENEVLFSGEKASSSAQDNTSSVGDSKMSAEDSIDDALSFLDLSDDADGDQENISTKLDLARAYLDMGDVEGARNTLEEVVIEGNDDQKREAEELLQQTG